jgi:hypothetical protein
VERGGVPLLLLPSSFSKWIVNYLCLLSFGSSDTPHPDADNVDGTTRQLEKSSGRRQVHPKFAKTLTLPLRIAGEQKSE